MTIDSDRSAEEIAADFNRSEEELTAEFKRRFDDGLTPDERLIQQGISEGYELRDKEFREAAQKHRSGKDKRPKIIKASQIKPEKLTWFYRINGEGVQPAKVCTMLGGIGGEGKSVFSTHLASLLSRGELEGDFYGQKHGTIVFGPEDDWSTVHVPRFIAAGADLDLIYQVTAETDDGLYQGERELKFPLDTELLEEAIIETGAKFIIVDPISSAMQGDMNKVQDVRTAIGGLDLLAKKYDLAVTLINHFKKGGTSLADKISGSHGFRDVVRSYLAFATDEESGERIITQDKNNYGTGFGSWKFALQSTQVQTEDGPTEVPAVQMLGTSEVTVRDLIDREHSGYEEDDRKDWESWLIELLTEAGGSMEVKEIEKAANTIGFNFKRIQKDRSKVRNPHIETGRNGFGKGAKYIWQIEENPMDSTETTMDPMHSIHSSARETMESMESMTKEPESMHVPRKPSCQQHGTNYAVSICLTCRGLAKETA